MQIQTSPFSGNYGYYFRGMGVSGEALSGGDGITNIDYQVAQERWINGCHLIVAGAHAEDTLKFQIVDVNNVMGYGAGVVLNTFADNWQLVTDKQDQGVFKIEYPARILAGLYIRIRYHNTGAESVKAKCNLFLHEKSS